jgi:hypothetical protein
VYFCVFTSFGDAEPGRTYRPAPQCYAPDTCAIWTALQNVRIANFVNLFAAVLNGTSAGGDIWAFLFAKWRYQAERIMPEHSSFLLSSSLLARSEKTQKRQFSSPLK